MIMRKRLIWIPPVAHAAMWKNPPAFLIAAMQPQQLIDWRKRNRWADSINMMVFTADDPPKNMAHSFCFAPLTGKAPHCVINYPPSMRRPLERLATMSVLTDVDSARAYSDAVMICAAGLLETRCAWIQPESDHSAGAVATASVIGFLCAYAQTSMMDMLGIMAAGRLGVDVKTLGKIKTGGGLFQ